jgi:hypothetical protein
LSASRHHGDNGESDDTMFEVFHGVGFNIQIFKYSNIQRFKDFKFQDFKISKFQDYGIFGVAVCYSLGNQCANS